MMDNESQSKKRGIRTTSRQSFRSQRISQGKKTPKDKPKMHMANFEIQSEKQSFETQSIKITHKGLSRTLSDEIITQMPIGTKTFVETSGSSVLFTEIKRGLGIKKGAKAVP